MTDEQTRDSARTDLELTTVGWLRSNGKPRYPNGPPAGTHWFKAMSLLDQISNANDTARDAAVVALKKTTAGYTPTGKWWKAAFAELAKIVNPAVGWTKIAGEHEQFSLATATQVRYGRDSSWASKTLAAGQYTCNNAQFGDPFPGTPKECQVATGAAPEPEPEPGPGPEPPPPDPNAKPLVGSITSGGTYTGSFNGDVHVNTTAPVVIDGAVGDIRIFGANGCDLTVRRCKINGRDGWDSPRWLTTQEWKRLVIENNTIVNTRGIELSPNHQPNPTTIIVRNFHRNPKGNDISPVGNFVQMRVIWGGDKWASDGGKNPNPGIIEIGWNHILSEYEKSNAEDVISIYKTARTRIHDNLIEGQSKPGQFDHSSQNSITVDPHDEPQLLYDNQIERNFVIDAYSIGMFGGNNNLFKDNFVISDGYWGDSGVRMRFGYEGLWINPGYSGNHAHGNVVGYVGAQGRVDGRLAGAVEGEAEWSNNTHWGPGNPSRQTEKDYVAMWHQRVRDAGITVGA